MADFYEGQAVEVRTYGDAGIGDMRWLKATIVGKSATVDPNQPTNLLYDVTFEDSSVGTFDAGHIRLA